MVTQINALTAARGCFTAQVEKLSLANQCVTCLAEEIRESPAVSSRLTFQQATRNAATGRLVLKKMVTALGMALFKTQENID